MIDAGAFYGAVAASSAATFGVGAAVLTTRLTALAERTQLLQLERGDLMNALDSRIQTRWAERMRRDALAEIHSMSTAHRRAIRLPLIAAIALVSASLAPLIGWPPDNRVYRIVLLAAFSIAGVAWIVLIDRIAAALAGATRAATEERQRERDKKTAEGLGFVYSGDPNAFDMALENLVPAEQRTRKQRRALRRLKKTFRKGIPPSV